MTTIAYDHKNKQIAVDSRLTSDIIISDEGIKYEIKDNGIWFYTGLMCNGDILSGSQHRDRLEESPEAWAIYVDKQKNVFAITYDSEGSRILHDKIEQNYTTGSGREFALAAIDFGKTAKQSIEYAMKRDMHTGGKVHVYDIESEKFL